jgi:hypothetical protein
MISENEHKFESEPQITTELATNEDVAEILRLQAENIESQVAQNEKTSQGYVSLETPQELLEEIAKDEGIIIAKAGDKIVGYLIPMTHNRAKTVPFFAPMVEQFKNLQLEGQPLDNYKLCVLAQICIDKSHRGGEALTRIHAATNDHLKDKYEIGIAEISDDNRRSLKANVEKVGMTDVGQYDSYDKTWHVVVSDFRKLREAEE